MKKLVLTACSGVKWGVIGLGMIALIALGAIFGSGPTQDVPDM